ncbi:MAG: TIGR02757 family protein [Acidobacteriota bacterium]|nr:TIGR02757 family protein [Acidobacteriota bacterium]
MTALRDRLDALRVRYDTGTALALDPLSVPLRFTDPSDREVAAWLAASLAYGRVAPMLRAILAALAPLESRPASFLRGQDEKALRAALGKSLKDWRWRFHTGGDVLHWLLAWKRLDAEGGLESHFLPREGEESDAALSRLMHRLRVELPATYGLRFSLPDPREGSACKRFRMFLRWMARDGWPDLGLWTRYPKAALVIPVDTHVARIARFVRLSTRATPDGRMAAEITATLRRCDPEDPLKYDFALSHLGILGDCPGLRRKATCEPCPLYAACRAGR